MDLSKIDILVRPNVFMPMRHARLLEEARRDRRYPKSIFPWEWEEEERRVQQRLMWDSHLFEDFNTHEAYARF